MTERHDEPEHAASARGDDAGSLPHTDCGDETEEAPRQQSAACTVRIESNVDNPAAVATALTPDNTESITTTVTDGVVDTVIERDEIGSLEATVDDYLLNLDVATTVINAVTINTDNT